MSKFIKKIPRLSLRAINWLNWGKFPQHTNRERCATVSVNVKSSAEKSVSFVIRDPYRAIIVE